MFDGTFRTSVKGVEAVFLPCHRQEHQLEHIGVDQIERDAP